MIVFSQSGKNSFIYFILSTIKARHFHEFFSSSNYLKIFYLSKKKGMVNVFIEKSLKVFFLKTSLNCIS